MAKPNFSFKIGLSLNKLLISLKFEKSILSLLTFELLVELSFESFSIDEREDELEDFGVFVEFRLNLDCVAVCGDGFTEEEAGLKISSG